MAKDATKVFAVPLPWQGVNDSWAREMQPVGTSPVALNVFPYDRDGRRILCQRPGLVKLFLAPIGAPDAAPGDVTHDPDAPPLDGDLPSDDELGLIDPGDPAGDGGGGASDGDGTDGVGSDPEYWRARDADGEFTDIYARVADIPLFSYQYPFSLDETGVCYSFYASDARYLAPATTNTIVGAADITANDGFGSADCQCAGDCPDLSAVAFGDAVNHIVEKGYENGPYRDTFIVYGTTQYTLCTTGLESISLEWDSDDLLMLWHADATAATETYSGMTGDPVTIALPPGVLLLRDTEGWMIGVDAPSAGLGRSCQKTITQGANSYTFAAGSTGNDGTGHVADMEAGGFTTYAGPATFTIAELDAAGWIDDDGLMRFKFAFLPGRSGWAGNVTLTCTAVASDELRLSLPLDEGSGTLAHDLSDYATNGTMSASSWSGGRFYADTGEYVSGLSTNMPRSGDYSITGWIKLDAFTGSGPSGILGWDSFVLGVYETGPTGLFAWWNSDWFSSKITAAHAFTGIWEHVCFVVSGGTATFYINNVSIGTGSAESDFGAANGGYLVGGGAYECGFCKLRVYAKALSSDERAIIYAEGV